MTTYTATIGNTRSVVTGDRCDVTVIEDMDTAGTTVLKAETTIGVDEDRADDLIRDADRVLAENDWERTGDWAYGDDALYAPVARAV